MLVKIKHRILWLALLMGMGICVAQASPTDDLQLVGQGEMDWFFFDLYEARFYSATGTYEAEQYPQALSLRYQRDIENTKLVDATITEWQRLGVKWQPSWQQQLTALWPSVSKGDELTIRIATDGVSRFYFNGQPLADITDSEFGPAFLAIWLDANSRKPSLTRQLKGN